jgi:hypothetical protein
MSHATCTQGNWGNSQHLVVNSQIANLTLDLSFGHNLCVKCSNGSCEPILDIYVPRAFQWYKELSNPMGFWPLKLLSEDSGVHRDFNSQSGSSFGNVHVQFSHSPILSTSREHEMWFSGFYFGLHLYKPLPCSWTQG